MWNLLAVAFGGALGAVARYGITGLSQRWPDATVPVGTLAANLLGCLVIGLVAPVVLDGPLAVRPEVRAFLFFGLLGGLTTFSTYGFETAVLVEGGAWSRAALNVVLHNGVGLLFVLAGYRLSSFLVRTL